MKEKRRQPARAGWTLLGVALVVLAAYPAGAAGTEIEVQRVKSECPDGEDGCDERRVERRIVVHGGGHHGDGRFGWHGPGGWHGQGVWHGQGEGGYLGVELTGLTPELREHFGVPVEAGVMVGRVRDDSPAFRAGLQVGDIITMVEGEPVASAGALAEAVRSRTEGETVDLEIWREGRLETLTAILETRQLGGHHAFVFCDEGEDCPRVAAHHDLHCPDGSEGCRIEVECRDGGCTCRVDGEERACEELEE